MRRRAKLSRACLPKLLHEVHNGSHVLSIIEVHKTKDSLEIRSNGGFEDPLLGVRGCIVIKTDKRRTMASKMSAYMTHDPTSASVEFLYCASWFRVPLCRVQLVS